MPDALSTAASVLTSGNWVVFAYVDPGTGSYLLQVALAGLLGAGYALRHFWAGVKGLLRKQPASSVGDLSAARSAAAGDTPVSARLDDSRR